MAAPGVFVVVLLACIISSDTVAAWDTDDFELFDVVEEVNRNFYELLGVKQDATSSEIRRAYRKLSLQLHPDKNKAEDAEVQFRHLVAVYEVLKDEQKRQKYHEVLEFGLPNWRQPIYYFRRARKMGILELCIILFVILTIGQFLVKWAMYLEKKLAVEEYISEQIDKRKKKSRKKREEDNDEVNEMYRQNILETIPRPRWQDLIPCTLVSIVINGIMNLPQTVANIKVKISEMRESRNVDITGEDDESVLDDDEEELPRQRRRRIQPVERQPEFVYSEATGILQPVSYSLDSGNNDTNCESNIKAGEWTVEEMALLSKAVNKFPGGTANRWQKISEFMGRPVAEVIKKSKQLQTTYGTGAVSVDPSVQGLVCAKQVEGINGTICDEIISTRLESDVKESHAKRKHKPSSSQKSSDRTLQISMQSCAKKSTNDLTSAITDDKKSGAGAGVGTDEKENININNISTEDSVLIWTQTQQKTLEWALNRYPKGTADRWDRIADTITGKNKEECISRFKYLAEMLKKRKAAAAASSVKASLDS